MKASTESMDQQWQSSQLFGGNSDYLEAIYEAYLQDPTSVDPSWQQYFASITQNASNEPIHSEIRQHFIEMAKHPVSTVISSSTNSDKALAVYELIQAYRAHGHRKAKIDPLNLMPIPALPELNLNTYNLGSDLDETFSFSDWNGGQPQSLQAIVDTLQKIYCGAIGFEYRHISETAERNWLQDQIENQAFIMSAERKKWLLQRLIAADVLEKFFTTKYPGKIRFSLEGNDSFIPLINSLVDSAGKHNVKKLIMAMAHRGRLNALVNVMGMPMPRVLTEFDGKPDPSLFAGDVKYHLGYSVDVKTSAGSLHLVMPFNPSHLEIIGPVAEGMIHANQYDLDGNKDSAFAIQVHGDGAVAGQGVNMEILNMSETPGYGNGGSIHIVINNQIGFTLAKPDEARSTPYCTDIIKMFEIPAFHVNSNEPEAVLRVADLALAYRMKFHKDLFIDLVGFRRYGHNEADDPTATSPLMYQAVKKMPATFKLYADKLIADNVMTVEQVQEMGKAYRQSLDSDKPLVELAAVKDHNEAWKSYLKQEWTVKYEPKMAKADLIAIAKRLDALPEGFALQPQVAKVYAERAKMTAGEIPMNWGYAETLAYATLVKAGHPVRLSGEDCGRGTFSHRHSVLHDQTNDTQYIPLNNIMETQAQYTVIDSLLSEEAVVAFEYGYSWTAPETLTIWEAQYGDFFNGAQMVVDQFIVSAEEKWGKLSGLTMLLPHGQEGAGPEHSSGRLERFLQACANNNIQVCVPSTPAQIYHLMRRQILRAYRKPLIIMSPKSLLRHPLVTSTLDELANGQFATVIDEIDAIKKDRVSRVLLCAGKLYYDLLAARREAKIEDIALIRIEQMYPFPADELKAILSQYKKAQEFIWCQEEPYNQGAWSKLRDDISPLVPRLSCLSRVAMGTTAAGYSALYQEQQKKLINLALKQ
ncbi:MAG: 2-oxoglutarate dehydrogenase E1 component [Gammaproteobacteria bacterium]|nr:2-oxoglutarate dehydrogenase E1 component [Gammaproteobacteria bacterium]